MLGGLYMTNREKLRMAALKKLANPDLSDKEYGDLLRETKLDRGKALIHSSQAKRDVDNHAFNKRMREKERVADLANEGKSDKQIEDEAYNKLYKERLKRGLSAKPPRDGSKRRK